MEGRVGKGADAAGKHAGGTQEERQRQAPTGFMMTRFEIRAIHTVHTGLVNIHGEHSISNLIIFEFFFSISEMHIAFFQNNSSLS